MRKAIRLILSLCALAVATAVQAQNAGKTVISGHVTDSQSGEPLIGASVIVKGETLIGTITDTKGYYHLEYTGTESAVTYSCLGYIDQDKTVLTGSSQVIDIALVEGNQILEESVSIGYGTVKKKDLSGAIGSTTGEGLSKVHATNLSQSLQGTIPGLQVTRSSALPGASATLRVRGITSISDSGPLIILDGVPIASIDYVSADDIESVTVLKDAASASIYGARAASGVILLSTKRAEEGTLSVTYSGNFGIVTAARFPETVPLHRYFEMQNEISWNDGGNIDGQQYAIYSKEYIENYEMYNKLDPDSYPITDWKKVLLKNWAPSHKHNFSVAYGNNVVKVNASVSYENTEALYNHRYYSVYHGSVNSEIRLAKWLKAIADIRLRRTENHYPQTNPLSGAYLYGPIAAAYWEDGRYGSGWNGTNAAYIIEEGGYVNTTTLMATARLGFEFSPIDNLVITGIFSPTINLTKTKDYNAELQYYSADDPSVSLGYVSGHESTSLTETRTDIVRITKQLTADYKFTVARDHNFDIMVGYEDYSYTYETMSGSGDNFDLVGYPYLDRAPEDYTSVSGSASEIAYLSVFGRLMYDYKHKYLFQANIRSDASSRFHKDYRWGTFPSVSGGWVITEEPWMSFSKRYLSFLKFRASYGTLGNERIGTYPYQAIMEFGSVLMDSASGVTSLMTAAQNAYNINDITWETTKTWDFGLDMTFFKNRLTVNFDYYKKTTDDMLLDLEIPDLIGYTNPSQNAGSMYTRGWEISLSWRDKIGKLGYGVSFNISDYRSRMGNLSGVVIDGDQVIMEGSEYYEWYGYVSDGLFQSEEDLANSATLNDAVQVGDIKFVDISGPDGVPDGEITPEYDRVLLGGSLPRYIFGGTVNLDYKGFDMSIAFNGVGKQLVQMSQQMVFHTAAWHTFANYIDGNYWSYYNTDEQNAKAFFPRLSQQKSGSSSSYNYEMSDYWLFNGQYFRLKNITLGYTLPKKWVEKIHISNVRVYASVSDLFSLDNYPEGWDPEAAYNSYIARTYNFGVNIKF